MLKRQIKIERKEDFISITNEKELNLEFEGFELENFVEDMTEEELMTKPLGWYVEQETKEKIITRWDENTLILEDMENYEIIEIN
jgi:hypothetical protein